MGLTLPLDDQILLAAASLGGPQTAGDAVEAKFQLDGAPTGPPISSGPNLLRLGQAGLVSRREQR